MKKNIIIIGVSVLLMFSYMITPHAVLAAKKLDDVKKEREAIKENLSEAERQAADILIDMEEMNREIAELDSILQANEEQIKKTEEEMASIKKQIEKLEAKIEERFEILKDRAKSYQANGGNIRFLDVLFRSSDFGEFISRVTAINKITDADAGLMEEQEKDKQKVEEKLTELEGLKKELEIIEGNIQEQKEQAQVKKQNLKQKKEDLKSLVSELKIKDKELSSLEAKILSERQSPIRFSANSGNGELGWPTEGGYISSPMGQRGGRLHKGIDIARTDRSTRPPIYAAEGGTVETAGTMNGYGNTVIINHGNGLKTLYGHMSSINVKNGQKVKRGQQVGVMGNTGRSSGIHLHFEVHLNGSVQNPMGYLN